MRYGMFDSQQALGFLQAQTAYIENEVYRIQYPEILYPKLCPIDTSAGEWTKSITYYSIDRVGRADWYSAGANDIPLADVNRDKREQGIEMAAIGYRYNLEELGISMMIPGTNLSTERAESARRASEEFIDRMVRHGDARKDVTGLFNNAYVTRVTVAHNAGNTSTHWEDKTADEINTDISGALTSIYSGSATVEWANTILLPIASIMLLGTTRIPNTPISALAYLKENNPYTLTTGQPLTILGVPGLETAGLGGTKRMVAYRKDPQVVKLHLPMPFRFFPVFQSGAMSFDVPGAFRMGSVEFRRPGAAQYADGI